MAKLEQRPEVVLDVSLRLSEAEARALMALTEYGDKAFLQVFYEELGESCLKPHEAGLVSLFRSIRSELDPILDRADVARQAFAIGLELQDINVAQKAHQERRLATKTRLDALTSK